MQRTSAPHPTTLIATTILLGILAGPGRAQPRAADAPPRDAGKLPHVKVDVAKKQVRVECQMLGVEAPLEFLCVLSGTNEHESVLRTPAKPSNIHLALLMLGLEPGEPVKFSEAAKKWFPPHGPPLSITLEFTGRDGKATSLPAHRIMRSIHDKKPRPAHHWIFAGSQMMPDGNYAADVTGYVASVVNFELSLIDIPEVASNSNDTLEWEIDKDVAPPAGTAVTMLIEPVDGDGGAQNRAPSTRSSDATPPTPARASASGGAEADLARLRERWNAAVAPHRKPLADAAKSHYEVITQLRREQQRLIDRADQIQRLIDELERQYQEMTTPRPDGAAEPPREAAPESQRP